MSDDVLVPIVTALTGLVSGMILSPWRTVLGLVARYDADVRERRLETYRTLWTTLKGLDLRARPKSMRMGEAEQVLERLIAWYHDDGGLLMSRSTQCKFARLQELLVKATADCVSSDVKLPSDVLNSIIKSASALRTSTTQDVLSRRGPLLGAKRFGR